jgi:outer membrane protein assembly factor BamA
MWLRISLAAALTAGACLLLPARPAGAADPTPVVVVPSAAGERPLAEIVVEVRGARRTVPAAVLRMMNTRVGRPLDPETLARDLSRLRATHMISETDTRVEETATGPRLVLSVRDKWSAFVYGGLRRGGARTVSRVGLSDNNAFGRLFRMNVEVNSSADVPFVSRSQGDRLGSAAHVEMPRLLGTTLTPSATWVREFFDFASWDRSGPQPRLIYDRQRWLYQAALRWDLSGAVALTFRGGHVVDRHSLSEATAEEGEPPPSMTTTSAGLDLQIGFIDEYLARYQGWLVTAQLEGAGRGVLGSDASVVTASVGGRWFAVPRQGHNVGGQLVVAGTTGRTDSHLLRAGGLYEIRGFRDSFFVAQRLARANLEYRVEAVQIQNPVRAIGQVVAFLDGGWVGARADAVSGLRYSGPVLSAGAGLRCTIVPLARAVGRIDFAFGVHPVRRFEVSFGMQQFF